MSDYNYPPIDPTTFDLIIIGTGLPESIIAAAVSTSNKSVLHLDPNPFYGSHFSSLSLSDITYFLHSNSTNSTTTHSDDPNLTAVPITTRPLYSEIDVITYSDSVLEHSRKFCLDVSGPRVLFCADLAVDLMLKSGANKYVEFKNVESSWVWDGLNGVLRSVPESRSGVFKDKSLGFKEKNQLNSFFKLVQGHLGSSSGDGDDEKRILDDDLESPFVEFLTKLQLPPKIKSIILYAIAMADYDQDSVDTCKDILKTKDGIDRLVLYHSSVGRFGNSLGALIYPFYGQGELSQAFCRRAAVKGCIHVLRMPVTALLVEKVSGSYKGVKLASGQEILSHQLVIDPSFTVQYPFPNSPSGSSQDSSNVSSPRNPIGKLARGICITRGSLKDDSSSCVVSYPPKSLYPEQMTTIRVLQLGSNIAVCPSGMFVSYISALCEDASQGKKAINAAIDSLFSVCTSENIENSCTNPDEDIEGKPSLLWSASYIQDIVEGDFGPVSFTPSPDGSLNYNSLLNETIKLYQKMYPDEEIFPVTASSDRLEDTDELD